MIQKNWSFKEFGLYLKTWSAYKTYRETHQDDPVDDLIHRMMIHKKTNDENYKLLFTWPHVFLLMKKEIVQE